MSDRQVLVIDDNPFIGRLVRRLLDKHGFSVESAETAASALERLAAGFRGVIILDVQLPDADGTELLPKIHALTPDSPVIFLSGFGSTDLALQTITDGAFEFLDKSQDVQDRLVPTVERAFEKLATAVLPATTAPGQAPGMFSEVVTQARVMRAVFQELRSAVESNVTVLIRGDSGTGKEVVARAIHRHGPRHMGPFVAVNCAGIPDTLLESEMFGYERGAFTGANQRKKGCFETAEGGTLFLDEIAEMHPSLQAKLLRVIQEGELQRLGGTQPIRTNIRLLSATNRHLEHEVETGRFREDLYYRLAVFTVHLPSLRERAEDVPLLVQHFVRELAAQEGRTVEGVDPRVVEILGSYSFPGNIRELRNIVAYAVVSAKGPRLTLADLPQHFLQAVALERRKRGQGATLQSARAADPPAPPPAPPGSAPLLAVDPASSPPPAAAKGAFLSLRDVERNHIHQALREAQGNKALAARLLGISRMTLYRKIGEHALE